MYRRPILQILNGGGTNILPGLAGMWKAAKVVEHAGQESDTAEITCINTGVLPRRGDSFTILGGWADEGPLDQGRFTVQRLSFSGSAEDGDIVRIELRAADYLDKLKGHASKHYDGKKYGEIVREIAKTVGLEAQVDDAVANIEIPYRLRWDQSHIDFLTQLSEEVGAICKPAGGKLIAVKRGSGQSATGRALTPVSITRNIVMSYDLEIEPRPQAEEIGAAWHDEKKGTRKVHRHRTRQKGPLYVLPHPFRSEDEAKKAAEAEAYERANDTATGDFRCIGLPRAHAEAPVDISGFGVAIDGRYRAESVEKIWDATEGFITLIGVKAGEEAKADD